MIYLQLTGGLGNQLFQYGFARAIQKQTKEMICINTYGFRFDNQRDYSLDAYELNLNVIVPDEAEGKKQWNKVLFRCRLYHKLGRMHGQKAFLGLTKKGLFITFDVYSYYKYCLMADDKYIYGTFQSGKYLKDIREELLREITLKNPPEGKILEQRRRMEECESVCVHVRRGDYISNAIDNRTLNICTEQYYDQAMKVISERIANPVFYVFSNSKEDVEWIRENYHFPTDRTVYITSENRDYEELWLMSHCKHFVIANSTFSWWAQYLSTNDKKIVAAPEKWYLGDQDATDIYEDTWIRIPIEE